MRKQPFAAKRRLAASGYSNHQRNDEFCHDAIPSHFQHTAQYLGEEEAGAGLDAGTQPPQTKSRPRAASSAPWSTPVCPPDTIFKSSFVIVVPNFAFRSFVIA